MDLSSALRTALAAVREAGDILRAGLHAPKGPTGKPPTRRMRTSPPNRHPRAALLRLSDLGLPGRGDGPHRGRAGCADLARRSQRRHARLHARPAGERGLDRPAPRVAAGAGCRVRVQLSRRQRGPVRLGRRLRARAAERPRAGPRAAHGAVAPRRGRGVERGGPFARPQSRVRAPARFRPVPSIAHRLALVAAGEAAAAISVHSPGAWDYAAGHALLRGAGAALVDEAGREITYAADGTSNVKRAFAGTEAVARALAGRDWHRTRDDVEAATRDFPLQAELGQIVGNPALLSRAQGCLLGQFAGDSLGSLVEFAPASEIRARYGDGPRPARRRRLLGDDRRTADRRLGDGAGPGAFDHGPGTVRRRGGDGRVLRLARQRAVRRGAHHRGGDPGSPRHDSQANGSLMRVAPLGILAHALSAAKAAELARADSVLTHPHAVAAMRPPLT